MPHPGRRAAAITAVLAMSVTTGAIMTPAAADPRQPDRSATATGYGGAVSTVDPEASAAAIEVLRKGGNAADAAVAAAATLGVTEPYSAGVGGGGYFVFYDAATGKVGTIDGRETAPAGIRSDAFINPATGGPYIFSPDLVTSGVSVGVPGTPATWERALERWGTVSLAEALKPAIKVATRGFVVDGTFRKQTEDNQDRFKAFPATAGTVPSRRQASGGGVGVQEQGPRGDVPAAVPPGNRSLLYRPARRGDRRHSPVPTQSRGHRAAGSPGIHDRGGPGQLPGPGPGSHQGWLPRV